ncbi:MAG: tetratricopeptide repeat protein [Candidatus Tenebribacter davisii]|nr:tetratricopeptide repeat protein [Candidatus Tenebribacter davisii]
MRKFLSISLVIIIATTLIADQKEDLQFAVGLYKDNNYKLAKVELTKFLENYPQSNLENDIKFLLGNISIAEENYTEAGKYFSELYTSSTHPSIRAEVVLGLGQSDYYLNKYTQAKAVFEQFVIEHVSNELVWKAYYYLGKISLKENDLDKAQLNLEKAFKFNKNTLILSVVLELKIAQNKVSDIDEVLNEIIGKSDSENKFRAILLYQNYNLTNGRTDKILCIDPDIIPSTSQYYNQHNLIFGITYYQVGRYEDALNKLEKLDSDKGKYYSALCYYEMQNEKKAKTILNELVNSNDKQISSNSTFYLARIDNNVELLQKFIDENTEHEFSPVAYYLLGYNSFINNDFNRSLSYFIQAKDKGNNISNDEAYRAVKEKTFYLIAESAYLVNNLNDALQKYQLYLSLFPRGEFSDEAHFKIGLINYRNEDYKSADTNFNSVKKEFPQSEKSGMSNYYLGEISFNNGDHSEALEYYQDALDGICDLGYTWERIAHIYFIQQKYHKAKESLENVPTDPKYLFDRFLLKGNIEFAEHDYIKALEAFTFADEHSSNPVQQEAVLSRKAWTLYQLKRYEESSQLYSRLSSTATSPEKYIIKAATSAFSAENYLKAIEYFMQYTQNFQSSTDYHSAILGIADSYYNLGDFNKAVNYYIKLIQTGVADIILNNAINGLRWASEQSETIDFTEIVDELLISCTDTKIRVELLDRKVYYLYKKEKWQQTIDVSKELEILAKEHENILEIKLMKALCYENLGDHDKADGTYDELYAQKHDPNVLRHWAKLLVKMDKNTEAINKLRKASQLSRNENLWLELLQIELKQNNDLFINDYNKFLEFANGEERQIAQLLEVEWKLNVDQTSELDSRLKELSSSKYKSVKAKTQLLKGLLLVKNGDDESAIPEFLRIRYLYPEFSEIRNRAEALACISYIRVNNFDEARKLFEVIESDITLEMKEKISSLLQGEEK